MHKAAAHLTSIAGSTSPTLLDWTAIEDEIKRYHDHAREAAFLKLVLSHLFEIDCGTFRHWITEGGNDRGVDAVVIDDTERRIHVITTKCVKSFEKCTHNFPSAEVDKALTFLDDLLHKSASLDNCNPTLATAVKEIWGCMSENHHTLYLHVCSNQSPIASHEQKRLELHLRAKKITFEQHHLQTLSSGSIRAIKNRTHRLAFVGDKIERDLGAARTVTGYVLVSEVARFLTDETGYLDRTLFNANIRDFLGSKTPINRQIAKTLAGNDREIFECLNNGIKIVCDRILSAAGTHPVYLINAQIVNGLQTANVLFRYAEAQPDRAKGISILVQITETSDSRIVNKIAIATNNQQRIGTRNLRANDGLQIKLDRELRKKGYRYLRKQGAHSDAPASQTIELSKLGQIILAYLLDQPGKAKTSNAIFGDLYEQVFDPKVISAERVIALHGLYRLVENKKQIAKVLQRKISREEYGEEWIIEGIFHVLYAVKLFCVGNGTDPTDFDTAKDFIDDAIEAISECFDATDASAYRFFRLNATRSAIEDCVTRRLAANHRRGVKIRNQLDLFS